jgi:hypothetical protein
MIKNSFNINSEIIESAGDTVTNMAASNFVERQ